MQIPDLYVLRHGETEWNVAGRWQGKEDSPLTARGVEQAEAQGRALRELGLDPGALEFRVSPQGRARRTAEIVLETAGWASSVTPVLDGRLVEIDVGAWTGKTRGQIRDAAKVGPKAGFLSLYARAPEGEPFEAVDARVRAVLADLSQPTIIVTHGITSRFLRVAALGLTQAETETIPGGQGVIHRVISGSHATIEASPLDPGLNPA